MESNTRINILPDNCAQLLSTGSVDQLEQARMTLKQEVLQRLAVLEPECPEAMALRSLERAFIVSVAYAQQGELRAAIFTYKDYHPFIVAGSHGDDPADLLGVGRLV